MELSWIVKYYNLSPKDVHALSEQLATYGLNAHTNGHYHALSPRFSHVDVEWALDEALTDLSKTQPHYSLAGFKIVGSFHYRDGAQDSLNLTTTCASFQNVRTSF